MNKPKLLEQKIAKCTILPEIWKEIYLIEYILTNFLLFLSRNFKNVTIDFAIHSHSASISVCDAFQLREKNILHSREELKTHDNCADYFLPFYKVFFRIFVICHGFYKHWYYNFFFTFLFTSSASQKFVNM